MNLFFDLDGTLTDPFEGITRSIIHALQMVGAPAPHADELTWMIGPALLDSFARIGVSDPQEALHHYRDRYARVGLYENRLYSRVLQVLSGLRDKGHRLFLMTAKPHEYAKIITAHFGISPFLEAEFGPELDGTRNDKAELLAHGLARTGAKPGNSVMIGDRRFDHVAARRNGLTSIAALWGYGTEDEHAQADLRCACPADLTAIVGRLGAD